ncbi:uncharacterized protein LOC105196282 [Solenopsis invicta]|uniref:uncharacterized protein LOC105196282 n=1 Tax=Solenopsis invicta TaxID=13686 RepID=UPI0001FE78FC|nr:uncharacterized protein LOC105196282 [Solenopsis invicta]
MGAIYLLVFIVVVAIFPGAETGLTWNGGSSKQSSDVYHGVLNNQNHAKYYTSNDRNQKLQESMLFRNESHSHSGFRKSFLSAWGIIALIIGVIIFTTMTYYAFILYPYLCKKDRTYDIIELTEVNSVCTDNANNVPPALRVYCNPNDVSNDISNNASLNR